MGLPHEKEGTRNRATRVRAPRSANSHLPSQNSQRSTHFHTQMRPLWEPDMRTTHTTERKSQLTQCRPVPPQTYIRVPQNNVQTRTAESRSWGNKGCEHLSARGRGLPRGSLSPASLPGWGRGCLRRVPSGDHTGPRTHARRCPGHATLRSPAQFGGGSSARTLPPGSQESAGKRNASPGRSCSLEPGSDLSVDELLSGLESCVLSCKMGRIPLSTAVLIRAKYWHTVGGQ